MTSRDSKDEGETLRWLEVPEIVSILRPYDGKHVLELGAGDGHYTGHLAHDAASVTAVDNRETLLMRNKDKHGHHGNTQFIEADVLMLELPTDRYDTIYSNWLLMGRDDDDVQMILIKCLRWLKDGGRLCIIESCNQNTDGAVELRTNSTKYRNPMDYTAALNMAKLPSGSNAQGNYGYDLLLSQIINVKVNLQTDQICWLVQKVFQPQLLSASQHTTFQEFLDQQQYSRRSILRYEKVFGRHFISPGGLDTTVKFVKMLNLRPGQRVLDLGAGIGGCAFYMAETYNVDVVGIDLSYNMVSLAWERAKEINDKRVKFIAADATKINLATCSFDAIYSAGVILHIVDKAALFQRFFSWLKPGGKVLITDYCCSAGDHSAEFTDYVKQRGYTLVSHAQYGNLLEKAGFLNVKAEDNTDLLVELLGMELSRLQAMKTDFIKKFSQSDYDSIVEGWKDKQVRCGQGEQRFGLFYAEKPHER